MIQYYIVNLNNNMFVSDAELKGFDIGRVYLTHSHNTAYQCDEEYANILIERFNRCFTSDYALVPVDNK